MRKIALMLSTLTATLGVSGASLAQEFGAEGEMSTEAEADASGDMGAESDVGMEADSPTEEPMAEPMAEEPMGEDPMGGDMTETEPVAMGTAAEAIAEDEESYPAGWFRVDLDSLGLQFWFGATHDLGGIDLATDIYILDFEDTPFAEFDIGPAFSFADGAVALTPMVGIGFDFGAQELGTIIAPQLFTILDFSPIYVESWIQAFLNSPFEYGDEDNSIYTRNFALYQVIDDLGIGPHVEATIALNDAAGDGLTSLQVGGATSLNYGKDNTLLMYLGYETQEDARGEDGVVGRFTFVRSW